MACMLLNLYNVKITVGIAVNFTENCQPTTLHSDDNSYDCRLYKLYLFYLLCFRTTIGQNCIKFSFHPPEWFIIFISLKGCLYHQHVLVDDININYNINNSDKSHVNYLV